MIISCKIDVTKIDKAKLFKGQQGIYLNITLLGKDEPDQYGNSFMVVQDVSKEERQHGVKGKILGNGKIMGQAAPAGRSRPAPAAKQDGEDQAAEDKDVPF